MNEYAIINRTIKVQELVNPGFVNDPLRIVVHLSKQIRKKRTFRVRMFSSHYAMLAEETVTVCADRSNPVKHFELQLQGRYCWMSGQYHLCIYNDDVPWLFGEVELTNEFSSQVVCRLDSDTDDDTLKTVCGDVCMEQYWNTDILEEIGGEYAVNMAKMIQSDNQMTEEPKGQPNFIVFGNDRISARLATMKIVRYYTNRFIPMPKEHLFRPLTEFISDDNPFLLYDDIFEDVNQCIVLYNLKEVCEDESMHQQMEKFISNFREGRYDTYRFILCGDVDEVYMFMDKFSDLFEFFKSERILYVEHNRSLKRTVELVKSEYYLAHKSELTYEQLHHLTYDMCRSFRDLSGCEVPQQIADAMDSEGYFLNNIKFPDASASVPDAPNEDAAPVSDDSSSGESSEETTTSDAEQRLQSMVGLERLKSEFAEARTLARFTQLRRGMGLENTVDNRHHMLFTGNPGTGKTTVAKLIGEIYHDMGILSIGHTVVTDRAHLIGEFIGESEQKVLSVLDDAKGGVLFVDEAYTLFSGKNDGKDYGKRVLESLLTVLSEPDPDMIVIFAGYEDKIEHLFTCNPGLKDRFPLHFHFDDYTSAELMQILKDLCRDNNYTLTVDAEAMMTDIINKTLLNRDEHFSNGRWVHNIFEHGLLKAMATRVMQVVDSTNTESENRQLLTTIVKDDVLKFYDTYRHQQPKTNAPRPRIGFVA